MPAGQGAAAKVDPAIDSASDGRPQKAGSGSETRELILVEASELFARHGYAGTSTRMIAQAVEIAQPSLFHHFSSKAAVMRELLRHSLQAPTELAESLAASDGSAAKRFGEYLRFDIKHILSSPYNLLGLHSQEVLEMAAFAPWRTVYDRLRAARRELISAAMAEGEFIELDVDLADDAITGLVLGTIQGRCHHNSNPEFATEEIAAFAMRALLRAPHDETLPGSP